MGWDISALFSAPEQAKLSDLTRRFPEVGARFDHFLAVSPEHRVPEAQRMLADIRRTGWIMRGVPLPESIADHIDHMAAYAAAMAPDGVNRDHVKHMALVHDLPEAVITDFPPTAAISTAEKDLLERLAVRVLYEGSPEQDVVQGLLDEFAHQETPEAQWLSDVDRMDPVMVALQYEAKYPQLNGLFDEFSSYSMKKLKTPEAKAILQQWCEQANALRDAFRDTMMQHPDATRTGWISLLPSAQINRVDTVHEGALRSGEKIRDSL